MLLDWYDAHARDLPWRVPPDRSRAGERADPYRVWLSEIMLQQTTVAAVRPYFERFTTRWPAVDDLAGAADEDVMAAWAGLGYYARARNLLKCARAVVQDHDDRFPDSEAALLGLPGIGPYTAAAIASIAFGRRAVVVDGNVERVMARFGAVETPLPAAKPELKALAAKFTPDDRPGDHAQALMDLGATVCTPKSPACGACPVQSGCKARAAGLAADLPRKSPKARKPERVGIAYVLRDPQGRIYLERRAEKGLLGGMLGFPTGDWSDNLADDSPPVRARWRDSKLTVRHVFTHFALTLHIHVADAAPEGLNGQWLAPGAARGALPTVMRKVLDAVEPPREPEAPHTAG
ncbi:A/G-specific adenine glycosylase [Oceanomicrobium pacificus]|uniref:Adenine DNA glycosylase n=1 Tax=Oceanomicrobium pacificus TaxID=2692916 RepID=A0A6B0TSQ6_9RHOB|nr:A/G-specific adenine glycosylase [Oceanomicrobium pacificus]MXU64845.1 A/G-specific adenine glycosylase [Oceanomicrobium pacificus]